MKENTFRALRADGREIEYEVLFTFESDETKKNYMVYTDNTTDEAGNVKVYASSFDKNNIEKLEPIQTDREWKIIEAILGEFKEQAKKDNRE